MKSRAYRFGPVRLNEQIHTKPFGDIRPDGFKRLSQHWPWPFYSDGSRNIAYTEAIERWGLTDGDLLPPVLEFNPIVVEMSELEAGAPIGRQALMQWWDTRTRAT